jgi:hypothetical protein
MTRYRHLIALALIAALQTASWAVSTHLDIMVPDIQDTDLKGPVKSVDLKVCRNVSGEFTTERREYDEKGNLLKITELDKADKLVDVTTFSYDENESYEGMVYENKDKEYTNKWNVVLSPETQQIALRENGGGRIGLETYSPEGYLVSYQLLNDSKKQLIGKEYKRDEHNRLIKYTRIVGRKPAYTYYYKWSDNGMIDMERQQYHQEQAQYLHTYEYLVTDEHGNWTQRILVRYDISNGHKEKVYEHTVQRMIEYYTTGEKVEADEHDTDAEENSGADTPTPEEIASTEGKTDV